MNRELRHWSHPAEVREGSAERRVVFRASTPAVDRHGTIVKPEGIQTETFSKNPIFVWAHDAYGGLSSPNPESIIGKVVGWKRSPDAFDIEVEFAPAEANPKAEQAFRLVKSGFLNAVSIGFLPLKEHDEPYVDEGGVQRTRTVYDSVELLEVSLVPIPSNPEAVALMRDLARAIEAEGRGVVPKDVSDKKAPEDTPWQKPTLSDFTDKSWDELTASERRRIAGHYAWAASSPPEAFGDLKLPHHRPSDGAVVWNGVRAAMAALLGARGGVRIPDEDRRRVYNHLARHYRQFDKEPPEFRTLSDVQTEGPESSPPNGADTELAERILRALRVARMQFWLEEAKKEINNG